MARRALCVGINEFESLPQTSWLNGCVNDAERHRQGAAAARLHGAGDTVLTDAAPPRRPSWTALTTLVDTAKAGDHLIFTFSSHGTQVPNEPGGDDEPDGLDEAFACHDIRQKGDQWDRDTVIVDDELHDLFARVPAGVLLEVLLDTCHSGTGLKDLDEIMQAQLLGRRPRFLPPPTRKGLDQTRAIRAVAPTRTGRPQGARRADQEPRRRRRSPCSSPRASRTRPPPTRRSAAAPTAPSPTSSSRRSRTSPTATRADLLRAVTAGLKDGDFSQRSTLEGPVKAKKVGFGQPW